MGTCPTLDIEKLLHAQVFQSSIAELTTTSTTTFLLMDVQGMLCLSDLH